MNLLLTGYGPFGDIQENPSSWLVQRLGYPYKLLEVSFQAVEEFLTDPELQNYDALLHLGVAASATKFRLELVGRNKIGPHPDVRGVAGPSQIGLGTFQLSSTIWNPNDSIHEDFEFSHDAGDYLCNYLLYRSLETFPTKKIGFLHVPPESSIPLERQLELVKSLIEQRLESLSMAS
jgi:pyrrolidone-carboxylate peptidase